ncbi:MAG: ribosome biogenesis GTPase RsgA [Gammaproteobacteria bacterium]|nr:MAG: ribosome biogenesis GTPase RsgA [Gammaproteobacteria bacterium]
MSKRQHNKKPRRAAPQASSTNSARPGQDNHELGPEQLGRIIAHYGQQLEVEPLANTPGATHPEIENIRCFARSQLGSLVTGDRVIWQMGSNNVGIITQRLERTSELAQPDNRGQKKIIAANIDLIIIVGAAQPAANYHAIDKYLVACESLDIEPLILFNKFDLVSDPEQRDEYLKTQTNCFEMQQHYQDIGYRFILTSSVDGSGIDELKAIMRNKNAVFIGLSGAGKSSLINHLMPEVSQAVNALSESSGLGTHTTTTAKLFHSPDGGNIIDSPGIREFALWPLTPQQMASSFIEFRPFIELCKFRDCHHTREPGCAVKQAHLDGKITNSRIENYCRLLEPDDS